MESVNYGRNKFYDTGPRKLNKNSPIFGNVAQTVAKISKLKLKVQNIYTQLLLIVKISATNHVLKLLIYLKM
jgi:hypothetical protein